MLLIVVFPPHSSDYRSIGDGMKECLHTGLPTGKVGKEGRGRGETGEHRYEAKACCGSKRRKMLTGVTLVPYSP